MRLTKRSRNKNKVWKEIEAQVEALNAKIKKLQELFAELERLDNGK